MGKVLMIGAGGVATVAAFKIVQNQDVFTEFMIASRRKEKCDALVKRHSRQGIQGRHQDRTGGRRRCGATERAIQLVQARTGNQPRFAISGPDYHGRLSGMRMQLSRHGQL